ncbi:FG-GAP-like repeat-containing protein [Actinacidiphila sp. bgisy144]|uniref:FG-GAP-like repeat-containing protein n=1 Tax=unclassified Actinacidiphila TaxID=2995708 RepID=UPI003EB96DD0
MHHTPLIAKMRHRTVAALAGGAIAATLLIPVSAARADSSTDPGPAPTALQQAEDTASTQAVSTGQPVAVDAATEADSTVTAQPDGTFVQTVSSEPERLQRDGAWIPLDATLQPNGDGTLSPVVSTTGLVLSDGGSGPLATLTNAGRQLALSWPTSLPTPTVTGNQAVYGDVLPNVDLEVTADEQGGFSEVLVVKTAQAAADPDLASLTLATSGQGVAVSTDAGGNLTATDTSTGAVAFQAAAPLMWDSTTTTQPAANGTKAAARTAVAPADDTTTAVDTDSAPGPGAQVAPVGVNVTTGGDIRLTPDHDLLTGSSTHYPVYIDPTWVSVTDTSTGSTYVQSAYPGTSRYGDTDNVLGVGYQGYASPTGKERTYYQFSIGATMGDKHISDAKLNVTQSYSADWSCTSYTITETNVGHISSSTTWDSQPTAYTQTSTHGFTGSGNADCAGTTKGAFDVTGSVSSDGDGIATYRLTGSESNQTAFKRFNKKATLTITYNTPPSTPTSPTSSPKPVNPSNDGCDGTYGWVGKNNGITLSAHVSDPDGAKQNIRGQFAFWDKGGSGTATASNLISTGDSDGNSATVTGTGGTVHITVSPTAHPLKDGHLYGWHVRADDEIDQSTETPNCYFWYDATAPTGLTVTSTDYPTDGTGTKHQGDTATFHLAATDPVPSGAHASGLNHFDYSTSSSAALADDGGTHATATTAGTYDLKFAPSVWGTNTLWVAAVDNAGNESQPVAYTYYVPADITAQVHPGDIDGDGTPDLLGADSATGNLDLLPTTTEIPANGPTIAADPADAPPAADGTTTWAHTLLAHRSSTTHSTTNHWIDDLWAWKNGRLFLYANNLNNSGGLEGNSNRYFTASHRVSVSRPACTSTDCSNYLSDWSAVAQLVAPGDIDGDGIPDLITVENDTAWLFLGSTQTGHFSAAYKLGTTTWTGDTLMAPGDATGDGTPDLWARNDATGAVYLYPLTGNTTDGFTTATAIQIASPGAYLATDRPLMTSPGDIDGDRHPDAYTITNTHQLWENPGEAPTADTGARLAAHALVSTNPIWNTITNLA